jgi:hypothetical protein
MAFNSADFFTAPPLALALDNQLVALIGRIKRYSYPLDGKTPLVRPTCDGHEELVAVFQYCIVITGRGRLVTEEGRKFCA